MAREVGVILSVQDKASAAIRATKSATDKAKAAMGSIGPAGVSAFTKVGNAVVVANQALQLGKELYSAVRDKLVEMAEKSIEFRSANDKMVKGMKAIVRESELISARFGDVLLGVMIGYADVIKEVTGRMSDWIESNKNLVASGLVKTIETVAIVLSKGVLPAVGLVIKAYQGWVIIIEGLAALWNIVVQDMFVGFRKVADGVSNLARALGAEGLAKSAEEASGTFNAMAVKFGKATDENVENIMKMSAEVQAMEKSIEAVGEIVDEVIAKGSVNALKVVDEMAKGNRRTIDENTESADKFKERWEAATSHSFSQWADYYDRLADLYEQDALAQEAAEENKKAAVMETIAAQQQFAGDIGAAFGATLAATKDLNEALIASAKIAVDAALQAAQTVVMAAAAKAAAEAAASQAGIPVVGPALAAAAAAAMFGLVRGFLATLASGGEITGGIQGQDSVPALLMPGERVLTVEENRMFKKLNNSLASPRPGVGTQGGLKRFEGGGQVSFGGRMGTSVTINMNPTMSFLKPPTKIEQLRIVNSLAQGLESAFRDGLVSVRA